MRKRILAIAGTILAATMPAAPAQASTDPFIGEIKAVGFNFCPRGWAKAEGQLLAISQNQALFSLLGTFYGGDGRNTFALPDLRGRTAIGAGTGPGLTSAPTGAKRGGAKVARGEDTTTVPTQVVTYCIALVGIYPSRS